MNSFTKYNTLDGANEGARLDLLDADGKHTEDWLHILGTDSQAFQIANRNMRRKLFAFIEEKGEKVKLTDAYAEFTLAEQRYLQAVLVKGWSFDEPCTPENVVSLLTLAPYVGEQIDEFSSKRSRFVKV